MYYQGSQFVAALGKA